MSNEETDEEWAMIQRIQRIRIYDPDPKAAPAAMRETLEQATSEEDRRRRIELMRKFFDEFDKVMGQDGEQQAERPA